MHVVFFGNEEFSLPHLKSLIDCTDKYHSPSTADSPLIVDKTVHISKLEIITSSHQTIVSEYCHSIKAPYSLWTSIGKSQFLHADIGVIAAFGKMLPPDLIAVFKRGVINAHPSLIPRWRGSSPIIHAIVHSDTTVGVTILQTSPHKFDNGSILLQQPITIDPLRHDRSSLTELLARYSVPMLMTVLADIDRYQRGAVAQSTVGVTVARKVSADLTTIDWGRQSSGDIDAVYRAAGDMFPLQSRFAAGALPVRLLGLLPSERVPTAVAAHLAAACRDVARGGARFLKWRPEHFFVRCADGWVGFEAIHIGREPRRRRRLTARQFYTGYLCRLPDDAVAFG